VLAADQAHARGQAMDRRWRRQLRHRRCGAGDHLDGCNECVADTDLGGDVASAVLAVPQRLAQRHHMEAKAAVLDDDVGPNAFEQLAFGQDAPVLLHERCE
jgi:hypothetical protein